VDLNGRFPDATHVDKLTLARRVVRQLLADGQAELWRGEWPHGPVEPLGPAEIERLRIDDRPWYEPKNSDLLVVVRGRMRQRAPDCRASAGGLPTRQVVTEDEPQPPAELVALAVTPEPGSFSPAVPSACP
jgi:hypothetical protein